MGILSLEPGSSGHPQAEKGCPLDPKLEKGCPLDTKKDAHWTPLPHPLGGDPLIKALGLGALPPVTDPYLKFLF